MSEPKYLRYQKACDMLRMPGAKLMKMQTVQGQRYFVMPGTMMGQKGGCVSDEDAQKIINRNDSHVIDYGLPLNDRDDKRDACTWGLR